MNGNPNIIVIIELAIVAPSKNTSSKYLLDSKKVSLLAYLCIALLKATATKILFVCHCKDWMYMTPSSNNVALLF